MSRAIKRTMRITLSSVAAIGMLMVLSHCNGGGSDSSTTGGGGGGGGGGSQGTGPTPLTGMLMAHNDLARTGQNLGETILNRSNVASSFGLIGHLPVDGQVYAQPLVANGVKVTDSSGASATKNLVFIATENDSVYAFDITNSTALTNGPLWHTSFISSCGSSDGGTCATAQAKREVVLTSQKHMAVVKAHVDAVNAQKHILAQQQAASTGAAVVPVTDVQVNAPNISPVIGITATPVIDPVAQTIYVTTMTDESGTYHWRLHVLSLATGAEVATPVDITYNYPGVGYTEAGVSEAQADGLNNQFSFSPINQLSRAGLVLDNGFVTVAFTSFDDNEPDHGWVFTYKAYSAGDTQSLALAGVWVTTPNSGDGTIWQSGSGPAVDSDHTMFFATGNGDPNYTTVPDFADSVIHLGMTAPNYAEPDLAYGDPLDYFRPYNWATLAAKDIDLGAGGVVLLPSSVGSARNQNLLVAGGKDGSIYLIDRNNMGQETTSTTGNPNIVAEYPGLLLPKGAAAGGSNFGTGIYGVPAYYNGKLYYGAVNDYLRSIPVSNGALITDVNDPTNPMQISTIKIANRGVTPTVSASGAATSDAIVWYIDAGNYTYKWTPGVNPPTITNGSAILYAFSTDNVTQPIYTSPGVGLHVATPGATQNDDVCTTLATGAAGCAVKFAVPTVQNGMVFVGTDTEVSVFGLQN